MSKLCFLHTTRNSPGSLIKWAKRGDSIRLEGSHEITAASVGGLEDGWQLVTTNFEVGGAGGVKTGYVEVELTQDDDDKFMLFNVGMYRPNLNHSDDSLYLQGGGWALSAHSCGVF